MLLYTIIATLVHNALGEVPMQIKLVQDLLDKYDKKSKPVWDNNRPINVSFSLDLYQILELNEPQQFILLNAWIIERWNDEFLYWNPEDYGNISELRLPHDSIWLPDTTLYNSLVMKDDDTRRLLNAKVTTDAENRTAKIDLLYPTIYKFSCLLNLRFFPFDVQHCKMTFSSWTYDKNGIDYFAHQDVIGTTNYLENEGWYILGTKMERKEVNYPCCPVNYTQLELFLHLRRKPLFYLVNLIIPTSIITLIAIVGFFTTSSASGMREEKVSLGITTLLSMSILMLMVSDQMPTTSTFIPLIGWFILAMIIVISLGTIVSTVIIAIQKRGRLGERLSRNAIGFGRFLAYVTCTAIPPHLEKELALENEPLGPRPTDTKPLHSQSSKVWKSLRHKPTNGVSLVSEKSTDPLIHLSPSETDVKTIGNAEAVHSIVVMSTPEPAASGDAAPSPAGPPPPLQLAAYDDDLSLGGSDSSRPATARQTGKSGASNINAALRLNRQQAQIEYEWLATVAERSCFILFVFAFLVITVGINLVGFVHWYAAGLNSTMVQGRSYS